MSQKGGNSGVVIDRQDVEVLDHVSLLLLGVAVSG